uniref:Uncharacterized protein n=1 Tax=Eutreptiella gymnastica TaxID=73025 RepID=A0A7S4G666_9EUGL
MPYAQIPLQPMTRTQTHARVCTHARKSILDAGRQRLYLDRHRLHREHVRCGPSIPSCLRCVSALGAGGIRPITQTSSSLSSCECRLRWCNVTASVGAHSRKAFYGGGSIPPVEC